MNFFFLKKYVGVFTISFVFIMLFMVPIQLSGVFNYGTIRFVWINFRKEFNIYNFIGIAKLLATFEEKNYNIVVFFSVSLFLRGI